MPLSELVKNYSINTISQKSNIPVEVLEKLISKDWENLQRAKVNGFLNIIEREFEVDLSEQRDEAKEYYASHQKTQPNRPIDLVDAQSVGGNGGKIIANLFTVLMVAIVAYAGWFYLAKSNDSSTKSENNKSSGMFQDSINAAKSLIGIVDKKESNNSEEKADEQKQQTESKATTDDSNKNESTDIATTDKQSETKEANSDTNTEVVSKVNGSNEQAAVVKKFDINIASSEKNDTNEKSTIVDTNITPKLEETAKSNNESDIKRSVDSLLEENSANSTVDDNGTQESNITKETQGIDVATLDSNRSETTDVQDDNSLQAAINEITITPTVKKIWIGIYNLKTKKRVVKVATGAYRYNTDGGDIAIVTGHSMFKIATNSGASSEYHNAGKRKYLLISKDGIKELTKQEYKRVTNRRAW